MTIERVDHSSLDVIQHLLKHSASKRDDLNASGFLSVLNPSSTASDRRESLAVDSSASDSEDEESERERTRNDQDRRRVAQASAVDTEQAGEQTETDARSKVDADESSLRHDESITVALSDRQVAPQSHDSQFANEDVSAKVNGGRSLGQDESGKTGEEDFLSGRHDVKTGRRESVDEELALETSQRQAEADRGQKPSTEPTQVDEEVDDEVHVAIYDKFTEPNLDEGSESDPQSRSILPGDRKSVFQQRLDEVGNQTLPDRESTRPIPTSPQELDPSKPLPAQGEIAGRERHQERDRKTHRQSPGVSNRRAGIRGGKGRPAGLSNRVEKPGSTEKSPGQSSLGPGGFQLANELLASAKEVFQRPENLSLVPVDSGQVIESGNGASSGIVSRAPGPGAVIPVGALPAIQPLGTSSDNAGQVSRGGSEGEGLRLTQSENRRLLQRVTRAFRIAQSRDGEIRLRLSPPQLGAIKLEMKINNNSMDAKITAETETARAALLENLPALRERLTEHGYQIESFEIELSEEVDQRDSASDQDRRADERSDREQDYTSDRQQETDTRESENEDHASQNAVAPDVWPATDEDGLNVVV